MLHGSNGILVVFANSMDEQFVCTLSSFPAFVAVHGVIPSNNCGYLTAADLIYFPL